jgi:TonB family protein
MSGLRFRIFLVSVVHSSVGFGLNAATATTTKSDAELSRALVGNWEIKEETEWYPFTKVFLSFKSNGTYRWIGIADSLGGREEREGRWKVTNGRLMRELQTVAKVAPKVSHLFTADQKISLQGDVAILQAKDGDREEIHRAGIPTRLPPMLPPHWRTKLIVEKQMPNYPIEARRLRFEGEGFFRLHINNKTGSVDSVSTVISTGHKMLDEAAISALKHWRFKPETIQLDTIPVRFTLRGGARFDKPIDSLIPTQSSPISPEGVRTQRH